MYPKPTNQLLQKVFSYVQGFIFSLGVDEKLRFVAHNSNVPIESVFEFGRPESVQPADKFFGWNYDDCLGVSAAEGNVSLLIFCNRVLLVRVKGKPIL